MSSISSEKEMKEVWYKGVVIISLGGYFHLVYGVVCGWLVCGTSFAS